MLWLLFAACTSVPNTFNRPNQVEVDERGHVFVSDFHHQRIVELDADGSFVRTIGRRGIGKNMLWQVWGMGIDNDGSLLVLDQVPVQAADHNVEITAKRFREGREVGSAVIRGVGDRTFSIAEGISPHPDGGYIVAVSGTGALLRFRDDWTLLERFAASGTADEAASGVVTVGDELWVVEQSNHRLRRLASDGRELASFDRGGDNPNRMSFPKSIDACEQDSWLVVADLGNHRVQRFDFEGRYVGGFAPDPTGPHAPVQLMDVAVAPDCSALWFVDSKGNRLVKTDVDGTVVFDKRSW